jgi:hypothetical protein
MEQKLPRDALDRTAQRDPAKGTVTFGLPKPEEAESYVVKRRFACVASGGSAGDTPVAFMADKGSAVPGAAPVPPPALGSWWKVTGTVSGTQMVEVGGPSHKKVKVKVPYLVNVKLEPMDSGKH